MKRPNSSLHSDDNDFQTKSDHFWPGPDFDDVSVLEGLDMVAFKLSLEQSQIVFKGPIAKIGLEAYGYGMGLKSFLSLWDLETISLLRTRIDEKTDRQTSLILTGAGRKSLMGQIISTGEGDFKGFLMPLENFSSDKQMNGLIREGVDRLTGFSDRQGFLIALQERLLQNLDYDLVIADYCHFSRLNQTLGPQHADGLFATVIQRLSSDLGQDVLIGRIGEDEIGVLAKRSFPRLSDRLKQSLMQPISISGLLINPIFSMGAIKITGGKDVGHASEYIRRASLALSQARNGGGWSIGTYDSSLENKTIWSGLSLEAELKFALMNGQICAYFQPIMDLQDRKIAGFEALARWNHPKLGLIPPDEFLNSAREQGLLPDLGRIMMHEAVQALQSWRAKFQLPEDFSISVNLSAFEVERPHLVMEVTKLLADKGLPANSLKLEITESDIMRDPIRSAQTLNELRAIGAGLSLDDFGTGFSSLSHLARLPMDTLKIDQSFVRSLDTDPTSQTIVRAILTLGRDLGLKVVAEGVETLELAHHLAGYGCRWGQGYGFARALTYADAEAFIEAAPFEIRPKKVA